MDLENISTEKLEKELSKRKDRDFGRCHKCGGRWSLYMGCSRSWREELHCYGYKGQEKVNECYQRMIDDIKLGFYEV